MVQSTILRAEDSGSLLHTDGSSNEYNDYISALRDANTRCNNINNCKGFASRTEPQISIFFITQDTNTILKCDSEGSSSDGCNSVSGTTQQI